MISKKTCPHCAHVNIGRAIYCFECRTCLNATPPSIGMIPRYQVLTKSDTPAPRTFQADPLDVVRERQKSRDYVPFLDNGLVCLRCSAVNSSTSSHCYECNALLTIPNEMLDIKLVGTAQSSIGQARTINEDEVGLWGRAGLLIGLVADGMGGAAAGEEASRFVREAVQASFTGVANGSEILAELTEAEIAKRLRDALTLANLAIINRIKEDSNVRGMGTTATMGFFRGNRGLITHIGDSRAYRVSNGAIYRVTDDHSFVEVLVAAGHITRRQAAIHPMRSVLYRALGHATNEAFDVYAVDIHPQDRFIICSDGLTRHVTNEEILRMSLETDDPAVIGYELLELANRRGGEDNISVVVVIAKPDKSVAPLENLLPTPCEIAWQSTQGSESRKTRQLPPVAVDEEP